MYEALACLLCRSVTRPAVSRPRPWLTPVGRGTCELKAPSTNGSTHVIFQPLDFLVRLARIHACGQNPAPEIPFVLPISRKQP